MSTGMTTDSSEMTPSELAEFGRKKAFAEGNAELLRAVAALEEAIENETDTTVLAVEVESYW